MADNFFSKIDWRSSLIFYLIRVVVASIIAIIILLIFVKEKPDVFGLIAMPFIIGMSGGFAAFASYLSQLRVPFAGLISYVLSFPFYLGDPFVWLTHKIKPAWFPVERPEFFNPPCVWVTK